MLAHLDQWLDFTEEIGRLYYADRELNGARITLRRNNPDPRVCTAMHVWATTPGDPDSFAMCGVWMKKPIEATTTPTALYVDFSEEVTPRPGFGSCYLSPEQPRAGYKVSFICYASVISSANRWNLLVFNGAPVLTKDTRVWLRFPYGKNLVAEATFTLLPPDR